MNEGLLLIQDYSDAYSDEECHGILRYDVNADEWSEWIPYPKRNEIYVTSVVLDEERQTLYIFKEFESKRDIYDKMNRMMMDMRIAHQQEFGAAFRPNGKVTPKLTIGFNDENTEMDWITIVNLNEKTFKTESTEMRMMTSDGIQFDGAIPVMVGNVFYIYHLGKCWKWNVETNQVELLFREIACYRMWGAVYCDMQYVHDIRFVGSCTYCNQSQFTFSISCHLSTNHNVKQRC